MTYRILSLDGGGAWALIEVKALMNLYGPETCGHDVLRQFDLVAANSGGSLVLGGLIENLPLKDLFGLFNDKARRETIFSPTRAWIRYVLRFVTGLGPKYSTRAKLPAILRALPQSVKPLPASVAGIRREGRDADVHLLIVGYDYDRNRVKFFRSAPAVAPRFGKGLPADVTVAEALHASTNAPVNYFDAPAWVTSNRSRYWDGAITGFNNPVEAAVAEAITLGRRPEEIVALSLGTAALALPWPRPGEVSPYVAAPTKHKLFADVEKLAKSILAEPPNVAAYYAHLLTCAGLALGESRIVRMNPMISPVKTDGIWVPPEGLDKDAFLYLCGLDMDAVEQKQVDAIVRFADLWLAGKVPNQPIRMDGDTLEPELGDATFAAAAAHWEAIA